MICTTPPSMSPCPFIWLASASPRRHEILNQLAIVHGVLHVPPPPGEDEPQIPGETAPIYVERTAREKAERAVAWRAGMDQPPESAKNAYGRPWPAGWRRAPILCADTAVIMDGEVLGKPNDQADAAASLARLSGRTHAVHTAVVLAFEGRFLQATSISEVTFGRLSRADIEAYCASGEPFGKAGAYAIQGRAARFVQHLSGSYSGVMGLPAFEVCDLLHSIGH